MNRQKLVPFGLLSLIIIIIFLLVHIINSSCLEDTVLAVFSRDAIFANFMEEICFVKM